MSRQRHSPPPSFSPRKAKASFAPLQRPQLLSVPSVQRSYSSSEAFIPEPPHSSGTHTFLRPHFSGQPTLPPSHPFLLRLSLGPHQHPLIHFQKPKPQPPDQSPKALLSPFGWVTSAPCILALAWKLSTRLTSVLMVAGRLELSHFLNCRSQFYLPFKVWLEHDLSLV